MMNLSHKIGKCLLWNVTSRQLHISNQCFSRERTLNSVTLLGRIGNTSRKGGSDKHPVVTFSLVTSFDYKNENDDWLQQTDWHKVVVFKPSLCDTIINNYSIIGQRALVTGCLYYNVTRKYDNVIKTSSIIASDIIFFKEDDDLENDRS